MKLHTEFKIMLAGFALSAIMLMTGCTFDMLSSSVEEKAATVPTVVENDVTFLRWSLLASSEVNKAEVKWGDVNIAIGGLSTTGDTATTKVLTDGLVAGIIAYATGGAGAVVPAVAKLVPASQVKPVTEAVLVAVKDPSAKTETAAQPAALEDVESAPPPVPVVAKVATANDVAAGKYAVVVLGNRKGCPLCRALWKPGFEAEVEKALPGADVIDADMTENPKLYRVYPYVIVFTPSGERIGAFTARGALRDNFIAEVEKLCPGCKPQ
jgi:hypothetical protein